MLTRFCAFLREDDGATAIEYALIASLITVACIGAFTFFGNSVSQKFSDVSSAVRVAGS